MSSANRYDPAAIEAKWQKHWDEHGSFRATRRDGHPKYYVLDMFPYPSGAGLHVGHAEGYVASDIIARTKRMRGFDVLHPMGWDAFGLPAEQHAIQTGAHPRDTTRKNIATFERQLRMLGLSYDWGRAIDTTDPRYLGWTQWFFVQLFRRGLAYQAEVPVNWCPALGTVLANEEVIDGKSERGAHPVERLPLRQWMLRITAYADRLDADLAGLDWPATREKQHHWIGRSEGAKVDFAIEGHPGVKVTVFTTRADTLPGATYLVLAPEHPLVEAIAAPGERAGIRGYAAKARSKSDLDRAEAKTKTGLWTGAFAVNPINDERIPVWVADHVLGAYGTGAIMAVPAHDERDHAFALAHDLPIVQTTAPGDGRALDVRAAPFVEGSEGAVAISVRANLAIVAGTPSSEARSQVVRWLEERGLGRAAVTYRLRDWVFSRQRYWGEPIPIYFPVDCASDPRAPGATYTIHYDRPIAVDESELPLRLPDLADFEPGDDPGGPLARASEWRFFQRDGAWFARETNTMPQWAGSCWYYLRFLDPNNDLQPWSARAYDDWMPVDLYIGGSEHAVLHLLYARFWHKVLFDASREGVSSGAPTVRHAEPFAKLVHQGMILGENNEKMSKSRGNVVSPDDVVRDFGADALRVYEMFMGPLEQVKPWQTSGIKGVRLFLERAWNVASAAATDDPDAYDVATRRLVHKTVKKVTDDIEAMRFNTAVSAMMILVNHLARLPRVPREAARVIALLLAPFAPHLAEEIWQRLGGAQSLAHGPWPTYDPVLVNDDVVEIGVQVNGKLRGSVALARDAGEDVAKEAAVGDERIAAHVRGRSVRKVIYVPGRILNFIVS